MNRPSGLSELAATTASSRRHRPNPNFQPEDRQSTPGSHRKFRDKLSIPSKRSAPIQYVPELTTPAWEVYRDPSDEFIPDDQAQQSAGDASANGPASAPHRETTQGAARPSIPPFRSRHTIVYAPNEASRIVTERMLRTLDQILAEEQERKAMAFFAGRDLVDASAPSATDEVIGRLERRYAELTLQEERTGREDADEGHQGSAFGAEGEPQGYKKKKKKNKERNKTKEKIDMDIESVEGSVYDQGASVELWLDATVTETSMFPSNDLPMPGMPTASVTGPNSGLVGASFADRDRASKRAKMTKKAEGDLRRVAHEHAQVHRGIAREDSADTGRSEMRAETEDVGLYAELHAELHAETETALGVSNVRGTKHSISAPAGAGESATPGHEIGIDADISMEDTTDDMEDMPNTTDTGF